MSKHGWEEPKLWVIHCRVSGGFTGTREALYKKNGKVKIFKSWQGAYKRAQACNAQMNNSHSTADFRYTVVEWRGYDPYGF